MAIARMDGAGIKRRIVEIVEVANPALASLRTEIARGKSAGLEQCTDTIEISDARQSNRAVSHVRTNPSM